MLRRASAALALLGLGCGGEPSTPLPADVAAVVEDRCALCHGDPLAYGALMPIVDWEDTRAPSPSAPSRPVWQQMELRVHDAERPMPPRGVEPLTAGELAVLDAWFAAGAPPGP